MKRNNKFFGLVLSTLVVALGAFSNYTVADASYTYKASISLGNNANASFDETYAGELGGTVSGDKIVFEGLNFGDTLTIDTDKLITISPAVDEDGNELAQEYYVKGLRLSGEDGLQEFSNKAEKEVTLNIQGDQTYVAAYGVGNIVAYTVEYLDTNGNKLLEPDTFYGHVGEVIYVPAKHVEYYRPNAYFLTDSTGLKGDATENVYSFKYTKLDPSITIDESTNTINKTAYVDGEPIYEYEYANIQGPGQTTVVNNRGNGGAAGGADNQDAEAAGGAENAGDAGDAAASEETIADEQVPQDVVDIADDDVALAGADHDSLVRNMIIAVIIAMVAVVVVLISLILSRRKEVQASKSDNDENS